MQVRACDVNQERLNVGRSLCAFLCIVLLNDYPVWDRFQAAENSSVEENHVILCIDTKIVLYLKELHT